MFMNVEHGECLELSCKIPNIALNKSDYRGNHCKENCILTNFDLRKTQRQILVFCFNLEMFKINSGFNWNFQKRLLHLQMSSFVIGLKNRSIYWCLLSD